MATCEDIARERRQAVMTLHTTPRDAGCAAHVRVAGLDQGRTGSFHDGFVLLRYRKAL